MTLQAVNFTKKFDWTTLKVKFRGTLRAGYDLLNSTLSKWRILFNGENCTNPTNIESMHYNLISKMNHHKASGSKWKTWVTSSLLRFVIGNFFTRWEAWRVQKMLEWARTEWLRVLQIKYWYSITFCLLCYLIDTFTKTVQRSLLISAFIDFAFISMPQQYWFIVTKQCQIWSWI